MAYGLSANAHQPCVFFFFRFFLLLFPRLRLLLLLRLRLWFIHLFIIIFIQSCDAYSLHVHELSPHRSWRVEREPIWISSACTKTKSNERMHIRQHSATWDERRQPISYDVRFHYAMHKSFTMRDCIGSSPQHIFKSITRSLQFSFSSMPPLNSSTPPMYTWFEMCVRLVCSGSS